MSIADKLTTIAENVQKVYDAGKAAGGGGGAGYDEGYTAGQTAEYDAFWDAYQQNGNRTMYYQAFVQGGWIDETLKPKYPIVCKNDASAARSVFSNFRATIIPAPIYIEGINADETFYQAKTLVTITLLSLNGVPSFKSTFNGCTKLQNITIEGSIDVNFNISATAVLSNESVQSIIDHLKDLTGATTQTLTFHTDVKMTTNQINAAKGKNWTVVGGTEVANDYFDS